jgi:catechol 2,3-dioxygenase
MTTTLAPATDMGAVTLRVRDLDAQTAYYRDGAALDVLTAEGGRVVLGRGAVPIVILEHAPELRHAPRGEAGLFHTAIVYDSRAALAAAVHSIATRYPGTFTGSSDHLVSNAFYFDDPEGNGVELYWDRDRTQWSWVHGTIQMGTVFLDPNRFLQEHLTEAAMANPRIGEAKVGHVHLQVGDVTTAREFYVDRLGFDLTFAYGAQAIFVSAGGYHHHMAMNTWNSAGAGPRTPGLGLSLIEIDVPSADDLGALSERMRHFGLETRDDGRAVEVSDPWGSRIRVSAGR